MSAYEAGLGAGRGVAAMRADAGVAGLGSRKANNSAGIIGRAHIANSARRTAPGPLRQALDGLLNLVLPVALLLSVGAVCAVYSQTPLPGLGTVAGRPLSVGLALLPVTFFVIQLTNRRYGATYAFTQMILAWILAVILSVTSLSSSSTLLLILPDVLPDMRVDIGFGLGLFVAQLVSVVLFDGLRGPAWWKAPLVSSLVGGGVLALIAFPVAYAGGTADWPGEMVNYLEVASGAAFVLLVPYGLLRSIVPPGAGFGGY